MSGDNDSSKVRIVLGDVTNRTLKRGLSLTLDDATSKSRDTKGKSKVLGDRDSEFTELVSSGVENLLREKLVSKEKGVGVQKIVSFLKGRRDLDISPMRRGSQTAQNDPIPSIPDVKEDAKATSLFRRTHSLEGLEIRMPENAVQVGDKECQEERVTPEVMENLVSGDSISHAPSHTDKDLKVGKLASNKFGSIEWSRLPGNSQGGSLELERCKLLKDTDITCQSNDLLNDCSCSFCLKAAYIWSDLHYQDIKGRIAALKKSQKEASALVQKMGKEKDTGAGVSQITSKPSELETNLFNQWMSLFHQMGGILDEERNQRQADYMALKDLREDCKMDLEVINRMPLKKD